MREPEQPSAAAAPSSKQCAAAGCCLQHTAIGCVQASRMPLLPTWPPPRSAPHLQAQVAGDGTFKYGFVMIDKAKQEIAAVNVLVSEGLASKWLLCYFHFLQEWERFLVSKKSGVSERGAQQLVMVMLGRLAHHKDRTVFEEEVGRRAAGRQQGSRAGQGREPAMAGMHMCMPAAAFKAHAPTLPLPLCSPCHSWACSASTCTSGASQRWRPA